MNPLILFVRFVTDSKHYSAEDDSAILFNAVPPLSSDSVNEFGTQIQT